MPVNLGKLLDQMKTVTNEHIEVFKKHDLNSWEYRTFVLLAGLLFVASPNYDFLRGSKYLDSFTTIAQILGILYGLTLLTLPFHYLYNVYIKHVEPYRMAARLSLFAIGFPLGVAGYLLVIRLAGYITTPFFGLFGGYGFPAALMVMLLVWRVLGAPIKFYEGMKTVKDSIAEQIKAKEVHKSPTSRTEEHRTFMDDICNNDSGCKTTISSQWGDINGFGRNTEESERRAREEYEHREKHWPKT